LYQQKKYEKSDIKDADMVLAVTDDSALNEEIYKICKEKNILVNVASNQEKCDFHFPGILEYEDVVIGFNGCGKDHKKVRKVREMIQEMLSHKGE
ncbi:MAG: NAD(P)-dependent oxidoreductase, partial [Blautia sp.]|nr:NAD(P)-dependent oxidoreductase [Blautia sp.]